MKSSTMLFGGFILLAVLYGAVQPLCVLESDFGFKINCAFKKSGLFRVRNLGGVKAHASIGFSLGDELGFDQSLTNQDPSRRRSVNFKNGAPNILVDTTNRPAAAAKQEKRGKQNRIMMRPVAPVTKPNQASMDKLSSLHRRVSTMDPIVVPSPETPVFKPQPAVTMAKPMPMGIPAFKPLPPKEETLKVLPIAAKKTYSPWPVPQSKPGTVYQNPVPHQVHDIANSYPAYSTKKIDDYNSISGYSDDTALKFNKEDIDAKIAEIAKAGNISTEAVEAAIALRQQQLLSKYANIPAPTTTTTTTTTTETVVYQEPEPEIIVAPVPQKPKRNPTTGKVMNAPREYYPVGYEKNFDDHFQSKVDLPDTSFHCGDQKYFPGLYGDETLGCMVFHVCALTDDGLVMKSFLCPESTLFDQTILKCNWWFYVDCKHTTSLYDTNIPVSKSYQLMKALTFFTSYKKEMENGQAMNPEDIGGVKDAITILQNQDAKTAESERVQVVTSHPLIDERSRRDNYTAPVYRGTREYNETEKETEKDFKYVRVRADISYSNKTSSTEEKNRRRLAHRNRGGAVTTTTTTTTTATTKKHAESPLVEIMKQEIQPIEVETKRETLTDQLDDTQQDKTDTRPVRRFYRSSGERGDTREIRGTEIEIVNNERVQIVRPANTESRLDDAVLGRSRHKDRDQYT
ncbi:uncharacterized protein LOC116774111 isoform X2 [Danaus plexippus]|uniref:uncharacterized protein LOC116774111 isoform X2 n=1 Tax=Danaus plexippus TaxID=13037 RepID=UPI002AB03F31|nr:uncharacterized protein LOC116774111 isoform X2 [Danaus plexippus]